MIVLNVRNHMLCGRICLSNISAIAFSMLVLCLCCCMLHMLVVCFCCCMLHTLVNCCCSCICVCHYARTHPPRPARQHLRHPPALPPATKKKNTFFRLFGIYVVFAMFFELFAMILKSYAFLDLGK